MDVAAGQKRHDGKSGPAKYPLFARKLRSLLPHSRTQAPNPLETKNLSRQLGVHEKTLIRWKMGRHKPSLDHLRPLATALSTCELELIKDTELDAMYRPMLPAVQARPESSQDAAPRNTGALPPPIHLPQAPLHDAAGVQSPRSSFHVYTGDQCLEVLCDRIRKATVVLNTALTKGGSKYITPTRHMDTWVAASLEAIRRGALFRDVLTSGWLDVARMRFRVLAQREHTAGSYECSRVSFTLRAFLNFTLFQYHDGSKEVFFGWLVSRQHGLEQPCISSTNPDCIHVFETWHGELFQSGKKLSPLL